MQQESHPSSRPAVTRVLRHVAVFGLFADVVLLVVAMALGGIERNIGRAAGALVALVILRDGRNGFRHHDLRINEKNQRRPRRDRSQQSRRMGRAKRSRAGDDPAGDQVSQPAA
jgi:hypothetical protein